MNIDSLRGTGPEITGIKISGGGSGPLQSESNYGKATSEHIPSSKDSAKAQYGFQANSPANNQEKTDILQVVTSGNVSDLGHMYGKIFLY